LGGTLKTVQVPLFFCVSVLVLNGITMTLLNTCSVLGGHRVIESDHSGHRDRESLLLQDDFHRRFVSAKSVFMEATVPV